jgi:hypothetical protein
LVRSLSILLSIFDSTDCYKIFSIEKAFCFAADTMLSDSIMAKCIFNHDEITGVIKDLE